MFQWIDALSIDASCERACVRAHVDQEPLFTDHFPGDMLLPGSIALELAAQTAGPLAEAWAVTSLGLERWAVLAMMRNAKFLRPVSLPAALSLEAHVSRHDHGSLTIKASLMQTGEDDVAMRCDVVMALVARDAASEAAIVARDARVKGWKAAW